MKRLISIFLVFSIFSAQANQGMSGDLKSAFDELNYSLTVEWDQENKDFYNTQMINFQEKILHMQEEGLTKNDFVTFLVSNIQNEAAAKDVEDFFNLTTSKDLSKAELQYLAQEILNRHSMQGASWVSEVLLISLGAIVLIAGLGTLAIWKISKDSGCEFGHYCIYP